MDEKIINCYKELVNVNSSNLFLYKIVSNKVLIFLNQVSTNENKIFETLKNILIEHKEKNIIFFYDKKSNSNTLEIAINYLGFEYIKNLNLENKELIILEKSPKIVLNDQKNCFNVDNSSDDIIENLHDAIALYLHEDNLNWTKFGMLVSFTFAFMASFFVLLNQDATPMNLVVLSCLISVAIFINYIFHIKILSGIEYMGEHKKKVKKIERMLKYYQPNHVMMINISKQNVAKTSKTVHLMKFVPMIGYVVWGISYFVSILNYFTAV